MIEVTNPKSCCGCTACISICRHNAISMVPDVEGFLYPRTNIEKCIDCGLCNKVCPIEHGEGLKKLPKGVYALTNKDCDVLKLSSSGGVFSSIISYALSKQGVVCGAYYDTNFVVRHKIAKTIDDAMAFRTSKYVQSNLGDVFLRIKEVLKQGVLVVFSGTPCQVAGLKGFLRKDYENLLCVDIICHCVASPQLFEDYKTIVEKKAGSTIVGLNMKDKTKGWGAQTLRIKFDNGKEWFDTPYSQLWMKIFYSQMVTRPSCHSCPFASLHRVGDVSIGDFWGIERNHPKMFDKNGVSLLMVNTDKGERLFQEISNGFKWVDSTTEKCIQPNLLHPVTPSVDRALFWKKYKELPFHKICQLFWDCGDRNKVEKILRHRCNGLWRMLNNI